MWTGIAAGAAALGGAVLGSNAAKDAAGMQANATNNAIGEQRRQFDVTRSDQAPYRGAGKSAIERLQALLGLSRDPQMASGDAYLSANPDVAANQFYGANPYQHYLDHGQSEGRGWPSAPEGPATQPVDFGDLNRKFSINDFWADPVTQASFQSGLDLGTKALKNAAPLTFGADSGAAMKELTKFGTDYTGQQAAGSQARFEGNKTNVFNRLMALIGGGQVANQVDASAGATSAGNIANLATAGANASGAARIAGANAVSGGLSSISNWWNQQNTLDRLFPRGGTGTYVGPLGYNPQPE